MGEASSSIWFMAMLGNVIQLEHIFSAIYKSQFKSERFQKRWGCTLSFYITKTLPPFWEAHFSGYTDSSVKSKYFLTIASHTARCTRT